MVQNLFNFYLKFKQQILLSDLVQKIIKILHSHLKDWIGTKTQQNLQTCLKVINLIFRTMINPLQVKNSL